MMPHLSQPQLVTGILKLIQKMGVTEASPRHYNAVIDAATSICEEFSRESVLAEDGMGLERWWHSDDTGMSSMWMAHVLCGAPSSPRYRQAYPFDPDDFGRCYRFLRAVPGAKDRLHLLRESGSVWSAYVDNWDEMTRLYEEEAPTGEGPKLYALMQKIQKEHQA